MPDVAYDTVAIAGDLDERNPLFVYGQPAPALLDDSTIVYSDLRSPGGRIVLASPFTGEGWEIESTEGAEGPGEFGGETPLVFPEGDLIHTLTAGGLYQRFARDGDLLESARYDQAWARGGVVSIPAGIAGGRAVVQAHDWPDRVPGERARKQTIGIYDVDRGLVAEIDDGIPDMVSRRVESDDAIRYESVSGAGLEVHARGESIVWVMYGGRRVTTLDIDGEVVATRELDHDLLGAFVDADGRIWARVAARDENGTLGNIVLDRELEELFRVAASGVQDASGDAILVREPAELDLFRLVLLRTADG